MASLVVSVGGDLVAASSWKDLNNAQLSGDQSPTRFTNGCAASLLSNTPNRITSAPATTLLLQRFWVDRRSLLEPRNVSACATETFLSRCVAGRFVSVFI